MAWIESHQSLSRHRKTLRAAALLRCDRHKLIGHLHELWWWALDNVPSDGFLNGTLDEEIEGGAEWDGEPGAFVDALTRAGFIDLQDEGRFIHDWYEFAGKLLTRREDNRVRQQRKRERDRLRDEAEALPVRNANVTHTSRVTSRPSHGATVPNPTQPNRTTHSPTENAAPAPPDAPLAPVEAAIVPSRRTVTVYAPTAEPAPSGEHGALWDAFTEVFGEARGKTERQRRGEACKRAREAHATPEEIGLAAAHWPNVMGDATLTELGMVANLGKLLHGPQVNGRSKGTTVGLHQQATQRATLRLSPEDELAQARRGR